MTPSNQASIRRRVEAAGNLCHLFDTLGTHSALLPFAKRRTWHIRIPNHLARVAFDLTECARTRNWVPAIGDIERMAYLDGERMPQDTRYRGYWHDPARNAAVGMFIGVDVIARDGRFYVIENNHGPSLYDKRRAVYENTRFDPIVNHHAEFAHQLGFSTLAPIALRWPDYLLDEFTAANISYDVNITPLACPIPDPRVKRIVSLPNELARDTFYLMLSGLHTPVSRFVDNKRSAQAWLERALRDELPANTRIAVPRTSETLPTKLVDNGPRWPNLVVKLANSDSGDHVLAGRFRNADHARRALDIENRNVPRAFRMGFMARMLTSGASQVLYQDFIPPDLDEEGRPRIIRVHFLVSPVGCKYVSSHYRMAATPAPTVVPEGVLPPKSGVLVNDGPYALVPPELEAELEVFANELGGAMCNAIERTFEVRPR